MCLKYAICFIYLRGKEYQLHSWGYQWERLGIVFVLVFHSFQ